MYIADLHIHSRYSRATSRDLTPEQLDLQARRKGIRLLGTGDFTHPAWREELEEKLVPAEDGLYRLKEEYALNPGEGAGEDRTRFIVTGEISSIYKQGGRVRKVHSLILLPGLEEAKRLSAKLETIGNIHSDGRPILGLSCHDLLEIMLELCPEGIFVPAHIWTPHFSMFGAFSGFDTVEECFGDLSSHIHAVETGLSSDPPMNWRLSALDRFQLISNSDAHSPAKLGREANLMEGELSYRGLKSAVETGQGLKGTIEFFPEEGKYHYDGHRKCHICLSPEEAEKNGGICPVCQKKLTVGVSHRVLQLADRPEGFVPEHARPFESLVPLPEVIAASTGHPAAGKRVQQEYERMLKELGTEFAILREVPEEDIRLCCGRLISEGIRRLREGRVERLPGFDGEYGTIRLFEPDEIENPDGQMRMFGLEGLFLENGCEKKDVFREVSAGEAERGQEKETAATAREVSAGEAEKGPETAATAQETSAEEEKRGQEKKGLAQETPVQGETAEKTTISARDREMNVSEPVEGKPDRAKEERKAAAKTAGAEGFLDRLNEEQRQAATQAARAICVIAGPGTGKTGTLAARIRYLLEVRKVKPSEITAVTFTNRAAEELRERLSREMPRRRGPALVQAGTFHGICFRLLKEAGTEFELADGLELSELAADIIGEQKLKLRPAEFLRRVSEEKNRRALEKERKGAGGKRTVREEAVREAIDSYMERLKSLGLFDFDDLLIETLCLLGAGNRETFDLCGRFKYLLADEFQDVSPLQLRLILEWNREGRELFVIGDPDQSIYGFRGSDPECFSRLSEAFPELETIRLAQNYRSVRQVTSAACAVISHNPGGERRMRSVSGEGLPVRAACAAGRLSEGILAAREINRMIGGIDMLDAQERGAAEGRKIRSFSDIAVLCRTHRQAEEMEECLKKEGIPYVVIGRGAFLDEETVREAVGFFRILRAGEEEGKRELPFLLRRMGEDVYGTLREKFLPLMKKRPEELVKRWMEERGLLKDEPLSKLLSTALFYKSMGELLDGLAFGAEGDLRRCGRKRYVSDAVSLMTLHASKGLEFPAVILTGVREGSIPLLWDKKGGWEETAVGLSGKRKEEDRDIQEERRLFYVGMTRAKEELVLTTFGEPSRFLGEIPDGELIREQAAGPKNFGARQLSLFDFM